jgi:hypothetical protein
MRVPLWFAQLLFLVAAPALVGVVACYGSALAVIDWFKARRR